MANQLTQQERDEDTKDFLTDLERAARSSEASDEWIAGFVRQFYGVPQYQTPASTPRKLSMMEKAVTTLGAGCAFGLLGLAYRPNSIGPALIAAALGSIAGYVAATKDRHQ